MDVIATDHAPHSDEEKRRSFTAAPFGIVGLETAVPLTISELVEKEYLTPMQMAEKMSCNPAKILGLDKGSLAEGKIADVVIIDPNEEYVIDKKYLCIQRTQHTVPRQNRTRQSESDDLRRKSGLQR